MTEETNYSGKVYLKDQVIHWESYKTDIKFSLSLKSVKAMGVYTTANGPFIDDWFMVFVYEDDKTKQITYNSITCYSEGREEFLEQLDQYHNTEITLDLVNSTEWASVAIWPEEIKGKTLFKLVDIKPKNIWERIKSMLGYMESEIYLDDEIKKYVEQA